MLAYVYLIYSVIHIYIFSKQIDYNIFDFYLKKDIYKMTESVYKPKACAFHPKETIFNFCRNTDCLLPLFPTCVDVHTE